MNVYVGNLAYSVSESDILSLFEQHGEVSKACVITDRETGRSKGFGFVEMPQDAQARAAISALSGTEIGGRSLTVNEARPKAERPRRQNW